MSNRSLNGPGRNAGPGPLGLPLPQLSDGVPKGYLRVLVFDADSALVSQHTRQLRGTALNNYDSLRIRVVVPQDGYVSAYVGNESDVDVYFDDITVVHGQGLQVQETQYDPTGLELAGLTGTTPGLKRLSQYKFNGKEFQPDLGLNWNHQDWRFIDYARGPIWYGVDPLTEAGQESMSPYAFGFGNAVRYSDPSGQFPGLGELVDRAKAVVSGAKQAVVGSVANLLSNNPGEQKFAKENTVAGVRAYVNGNEARAKSKAASLPGGEGDGTPLNALRHGILSATTTKALGPVMAKKATDAHEQAGATILQDRAKNLQELTQTGKTTMSNVGDMADSFVDQLNNAAGRQIATSNPQASDYQLQNLTLEALQGGNSTLPRLYIFSPVPNSTNVIITPASLTNEAFMQARWNMNAPTPSPRLLSPLP